MNGSFGLAFCTERKRSTVYVPEDMFNMGWFVVHGQMVTRKKKGKIVTEDKYTCCLQIIVTDVHWWQN